MGLDMYAHRARKSILNQGLIDVKFRRRSQMLDFDFAYWRKFRHLHNWMEDLYHHNGGTDQFNCVNIVVTLEDLDDLERDTRDGNLRDTGGFFFGDGELTEDDKEEIYSFIERARAVYADGDIVVYSSWW